MSVGSRFAHSLWTLAGWLAGWLADGRTDGRTDAANVAEKSPQKAVRKYKEGERATEQDGRALGEKVFHVFA